MYISSIGNMREGYSEVVYYKRKIKELTEAQMERVKAYKARREVIIAKTQAIIDRVHLT